MRARELAMIFAFLGGTQTMLAPTMAHAAPKAPPAKAAPVKPAAAKPAAQSGDAYSHLGGMKGPIASMKQAVLLALFHPEVFETLGGSSAHGGVPTGVLIKGPRNVGKSELATATRDAVTAKGGFAMMVDSTGMKPSEIESIFGTAIALAKGMDPEDPEAKPNWENAKPVALIFDEVHRLAKMDDKRSENIATFNAKLKLIKKEMATNPQMKRISIVGVTSEPKQVDESLTRKGALEVPVNIEMPDEADRLDILTKLTAGSKLDAAGLKKLVEFAQKTNGWAPGDLARATRMAQFKALLRQNPHAKVESMDAASLAKLSIHVSDLESAMKETAPEGTAAAAMGVKVKEVMLDDVIGQDDMKQQVKGIMARVKNPEAAKKLGAKHDRLLVFTGPPGVGKTMSAAAIATELGVPFLTLDGTARGSLVGQTEGNIAAVFQKAKAMGSAVIFMDEAEGLLAQRGSRPGDPTHDSAVDVVLAHTDGVEDTTGKNIIVILATNHPEALDSAIYSHDGGGRGVLVQFHALSEKDTANQYGKLLSKINHDKDVTPEKLAKLAKNMAGRAVDKVMSQAGTLALLRGASSVSMEDYENAVKLVRPATAAVGSNDSGAAPVTPTRKLGVQMP